MLCPSCRKQSSYELFFMGFLDYRLGYVVLECRACHRAAYSLNMSNISEIGDRQIGDFRLCELPDNTVGNMLYDEKIDPDLKREVVKEVLLRKAKDREVTIANHDQLRGRKFNLESLLRNKKQGGRFTNGAL